LEGLKDEWCINWDREPKSRWARHFCKKQLRCLHKSPKINKQMQPQRKPG